MSELVVKKVTFGDSSYQQTAADRSFRNKIINGDMAINQERGGVAVTPTTTTYVLDQWVSDMSQASKLTFQQVADAPPGFKYSEKITVASQFSPGAADAFILDHPIEGLNIIDFAFGSASAATIVLSLWVKGSVPGAYAFSLRGAGARSLTVTIPVTTVWAKQSVVIPGDIAGTWVTTNAEGLRLRLALGSGSAYLAPTIGVWAAASYVSHASAVQFVNQPNGSTLNITGVQLEKAGAASEFECVPYAESLRRCQRYWESGHFNFTGYSLGGNGYGQPMSLKTEKRITPTMTMSGTGAINVTNASLSALNTATFENGGYATSQGVAVFNGSYQANARL